MVLIIFILCIDFSGGLRDTPTRDSCLCCTVDQTYFSYFDSVLLTHHFQYLHFMAVFPLGLPSTSTDRVIYAPLPLLPSSRHFFHFQHFICLAIGLPLIRKLLYILTGVTLSQQKPKRDQACILHCACATDSDKSKNVAITPFNSLS